MHWSLTILALILLYGGHCLSNIASILSTAALKGHARFHTSRQASVIMRPSTLQFFQML